MNRAVKIRIYPNKEQITQIEKTIGCSRFLYNRMLADKIRHYQEEKKMLKNTPAGYKKEYPWLKEMDSLALANVQLNLEGAFRKFFREPGVGFPHYKSKKHSRKSYTTNMVNGNICLQDRFLKLPKMQPVKIKLHRMIPEGWKLKSVTVSREPSGKYFASLLFDCENQTAEKRQAEKFLGMDFAMHGMCVFSVTVSREPSGKYFASLLFDCENQTAEKRQAEKFLGMDFAMHGMCVFSTGERAGYPMFYRNAEKKLAREQRKLSRCEKGSRNYQKQKKKVALYHEKIKNQRKDFQHKLSHSLAEDYDAVCVEDLNLKGMAGGLHFGKGIQDNGYGQFLSMLGYKLEERGKYLIKVDRYFASSKICSVCGHKKKELALSERIYLCECGNRMDRDVNAAVNI
ncbi:IS200/IS605 family element transposase accessory protein TnpB, partial [Blautia wexlerae]|nr:IS200/IS605 family element transposase accessory protein TnpB [Blautia wexlerae]